MEQEQAQQNQLEEWAIVELFGHQKIAGFVRTQAFGTAVMFRVDVPALPERDYTLEAPTWHDGAYLEAGSKMRRGAVDGRTRILGVGAIYAINPCSELAAMRAIEQLYPQPIKVIEPIFRKQIEGEGEEDDDRGGAILNETRTGLAD